MALLAHWKLDENTGTSAADNSGNGNTGTLENMEAEDWVAGKSNYALAFGGTDERVNCGNGATLQLGTGDFSISAWFKTADQTKLVIIAKTDNTITTNYQGFYLASFWTNKIRFMMSDETLTNFDFDISDYGDNEWHHIVITCDRDSATGLKLYIDNVFISSKDPTTRNGSLNNPQSLYLGAIAVIAPGDWGICSIDEVSIYNVVFTQTQVTWLFNNPAGENPPTYTLICEAGTFVLTGIAVGLLRPIINMAVTVGEFTLTGINIAFTTFISALKAAFGLKTGKLLKYKTGKETFPKTGKTKY